MRAASAQCKLAHPWYLPRCELHWGNAFRNADTGGEGGVETTIYKRDEDATRLTGLTIHEASGHAPIGILPELRIDWTMVFSDDSAVWRGLAIEDSVGLKATLAPYSRAGS